MKRTLQYLFLAAGLLLANNVVSAQEYKERVVNGDFEGSDISGFTIYTNDDEGSRSLEASDIVVDDDDPNNHCVKISLDISPSYAQFLIDISEPLSEGDIIIFSMRAKRTAGKLGYLRWTDVLGVTSFYARPEEWSTSTEGVTISAEQNGCQTITLSFGRTFKKGDVVYLDDISLKVYHPDHTPISFADAKVKEICVSNWDTDGDGELSTAEAAVVKDLGWAFSSKDITSFDELNYFVGLESLGHFGNCPNLTSVIIPNSVTEIGEGAFLDCPSLTSVTIPNSVKTIGDYAFQNCSGLTFITIPNSVTRIEYEAFAGCTSLTSITIPNSVTIIRRRAFVGCTSMTSVTIPNSVTEIGRETFERCSGLTSLTIPNSVTEIGDDAFLRCSGLTSIIVEEGNPTYDSRNNCNALIRTADNVLLLGCENTVIPNDIVSIGSGAFYGCGLKSITIPNGVTTIEKNAFRGCSGLTSLTIPNSVVSIGDYAFASCSNLTSIRVIEENIYYTSIDDVLFNKNRTVILQYPAGKTEVSYSIPNSVTEVGNGAFDGCEILTTVTIPNSVTSIGEDAFYNCTGLTSVHITDLTAWCNISFTGYHINGTNYANPLNYAHHLYLNDEEIKDLVIPNSIGSIRDCAFNGCSSLTSVIIPNGVTSIGEGAFTGCTGLLSVSIPNSVTSIIGSPFFLCTGLKDVISYIEEPFEIGFYTFQVYWGYNVNFTPATLYVPIGTKTKYEATEGWKYFQNIVEGTPVMGNTKDIVAIVNYIMGNKPNGFNEDAADTNGDGKINIADIVKLVNNITGK